MQGTKTFAGWEVGGVDRSRGGLRAWITHFRERPDCGYCFTQLGALREREAHATASDCICSTAFAIVSSAQAWVRTSSWSAATVDLIASRSSAMSVDEL